MISAGNTSFGSRIRTSAETHERAGREGARDMLKEEVAGCLTGLVSSGDGEARAHFAFPAAFTGFQGHFPGRPILPGVCMVQAALAAHAAWRKRPSRLREVVVAKFFSAVGPGEPVEMAVQERPESPSGALVKARISAPDRKIAEMSLRIAWENADE